MDDIQILTEEIKMKVRATLLHPVEFHPFGTYINNEDQIVTVGVYNKDTKPQSQEMIDRLEKCFKSDFINDYKLGGMAVNILIAEKGEKFDALQIRFFKAGEELSEIRLKYLINKGSVEFSNQ